MSHVVTLIAAPSCRAHLPALAAALGTALDSVQPTIWLAEDACDIPFHPASEAALSAARAVVDKLRASAAVDAVIQPSAGRRKRMLTADMDSTITQQECLDEMAFEAGIGPKISVLTERAMSGELNFQTSFRERIGLLHGFPEARLQHVLDTRITLTPGARTLTATMRANGGRTVLVSGGFTVFTGAVAERAGFDAHHGNRCVIANGAIVGVAEPILGQNAKLAVMQAEAAALGIGLDEVIAVGDGANDLAMIKAAGLGIAFHAKPLVATEAAARIDHGDLTALLYLQGYRREEFAGASGKMD